MARTIVAKLSSVRIMTAASFDTSVPVMPIATPMSAFLSAGASFTPSPVIATMLLCFWRAWTRRILSSGATRATTPISGSCCGELLVGERRELRAGEGPTTDAQLLADGGGRHRVVAGDHPDVDAGAVALGDRRLRLGPGRIDDADHGDDRQVLHQRDQVAVGVELVGIEVAPCDHHHPLARPGHALVLRERGRLVVGGDVTDLAVGRPVGARAGDEHVGGALHEAADHLAARSGRSSGGTSP